MVTCCHRWQTILVCWFTTTCNFLFVALTDKHATSVVVLRNLAAHGGFLFALLGVNIRAYFSTTVFFTSIRLLFFQQDYSFL